jgi:hypothetical protein
VRRLVDCLFPDDPRAAVAHAHLLTDPRPPPPAPAGGAAAGRGAALTTVEFLRRLGLEKYAYGLEDAGYGLAQDLALLDAGALEKHGVGDKRDAEAILDVLAVKDARAELVAAFQRPDRRRAAALFLEAFPGERAAAERFAAAVTDAMGHGLASALQIARYLDGAPRGGDTHAAAAAAAAGARARLVDAPREPRPPPAPAPAPPSDFVYGMLKAGGLECYAEQFIGQGLGTREELAAEPRLRAEDLKAIGVEKLGHQRAILRMLAAL